MKHLKTLLILLLISFLTGCSSIKEMNGTFVHLNKNKEIENSEFRVYIPQIIDNEEQGKIYNSGDFKIQYSKKQNIEGAPLIILDKNGNFITKKIIPTRTNRVLILYNGLKNEIIFVKEGENFDRKYTTALREFKKLPNSYTNHSPIYPGCENNDVENYSACFSNKINRHISQYLYIDPLDIPSGRKSINVSFEVDESGKVNIISINAQNSELKKKVIKVLKKLPIMKPATKDNKPIKMEYNIPIFIVK